MRMTPSVGAGRVLPATKHVKNKKAAPETLAAASEPTLSAHHGAANAATDADRSANADPDADRFCVLLSKPSSDLVRWYCAITHHDEARTIDALVYETLGNAKSSYEGEGGDDFDCALASVLEGPSTLEELIVQGSSALPQLISRKEAK